MSIKVFGYSPPAVGGNVLRGVDVANDIPGSGLDPAIAGSGHLIGKPDGQLGLPMLCAHDGGGIRVPNSESGDAGEWNKARVRRIEAMLTDIAERIPGVLEVRACSCEIYKDFKILIKHPDFSRSIHCCYLQYRSAAQQLKAWPSGISFTIPNPIIMGINAAFPRANHTAEPMFRRKTTWHTWSGIKEAELERASLS